MGGINTTGDNRFFERYERLIRREIFTGLKQATTILQGQVRAVITRKKLIDTGNLRNSIQTSIIQEPRRFLGVIGTNVLYALPLELGAKHLRPPRFPAKFFETGVKEGKSKAFEVINRHFKRAEALVRQAGSQVT